MNQRRQIDWSQLHQRLARAQLLAERSTDWERGQAAAILRRRTERLARNQTVGTKAGAALSVLVFRLGRERYAIPLTELAEVCAPANATPVPGSPAAIAGVINFRGEICPVLNLAPLLGIERDGGAGPLVMLRAPERHIAIRVDHIEGLRAIAPGDLESPAQGVADFVHGITGDTVMCLNSSRVLSGLLSQETTI